MRRYSTADLAFCLEVSVEAARGLVEILERHGLAMKAGVRQMPRGRSQNVYELVDGWEQRAVTLFSEALERRR